MRLTPAFATCSHSQLARIRNLAAFATWLHDPDDSVLPAYRSESVMQAVGPLTASTNQGVKDFFLTLQSVLTPFCLSCLISDGVPW